MVRNEIDVIEGCLRHMAGEVDDMIVADNMSTDGTREVLQELAEELPLTVVDDLEVGYYQSRKMTDLADRALAEGADWIVPFDADELWVSTLGPIRDVLRLAKGNVAPAELFNHWTTAVDPLGSDPFITMEWRDPGPSVLPKVAFKASVGAVIQQGNHGVTLPGPVHLEPGLLAVHHFPYRSVDQFTAKSRQGADAYKATDLAASVGAHWRLYGEVLEKYGESALHEHFRRHFWHLVPVDSGLVHDPAPYRRWELDFSSDS
jgi:hypothetical protein